MNMALLDFGFKAIMGIGQGYVAKAQAKAQTTVNAANAYASNLVRAANNELGSKVGSLARYNQSVNNQRALDNTGSAIEAVTVNYRRAKDSALQDDFESQIRFAEQMGAQAAAGALSGLQGGVVDVINGTTALRQSRVNQRVLDSAGQQDADAKARLRHTALAGWDSLDTSSINENMDYNINVAEKVTRSGNLFTDIMGGQSNQTLASATSYLGNAAKQTFTWSAGSAPHGIVGGI